MYNIIETNQVADYPYNTDTILNLHIVLDPYIQITKVELYRCLCDMVNYSNKIQIYLYTIPDKSWIKELDKLMVSVFKSYYNLNIILIRDFNKNIKDTSNVIDFKTNCLLSRELSLKSVLTGVSIKTIIFDNIKQLTSKLVLKILFVDQAEKESTDDLVDQYRTKNNNILSKFNDLIDTHIDFYSIFTEINTIETLIKSNNKDKSKDTILIVIDSIDRSSSVNPNNNSYYIPIDTYITSKILSKVVDIVLTNIHK